MPKRKYIAKEQVLNSFLGTIRRKNNRGNASLGYTIRTTLAKNKNIVLDRDQPDQLNCMICLNFLVHPVLMKCNHIACEYCLDEYALKDLVRLRKSTEMNYF